MPTAVCDAQHTVECGQLYTLADIHVGRSNKNIVQQYQSILLITILAPISCDVTKICVGYSSNVNSSRARFNDRQQ